MRRFGGCCRLGGALGEGREEGAYLRRHPASWGPRQGRAWCEAGRVAAWGLKKRCFSDC